MIMAGFKNRFLLISRLLFLVSVLPQFFLSLVRSDLMTFLLSAARHYIAPSSILYNSKYTNKLSSCVRIFGVTNAYVVWHYADNPFLRQVIRKGGGIPGILALKGQNSYSYFLY